MEDKQLIERVETLEKDMRRLEEMFKKLLIVLYPNCLGQQDVHYISDETKTVE